MAEVLLAGKGNSSDEGSHEKPEWEIEATNKKPLPAGYKYINLIHYDKAVKMDIMVLPAVLKHKMTYNTVDRLAN